MSTDLSFLTQLEEIIQSRIDNPVAESYISQLVESGEKRVAQKIGMTFEGVSPSRYVKHGVRYDQLNHGITRTQWESHT